jgi:hypothetical protein
MSASQPIRVVVDYGLLSTSGTGCSDPFIVKTGILYAVRLRKRMVDILVSVTLLHQMWCRSFHNLCCKTR